MKSFIITLCIIACCGYVFAGETIELTEEQFYNFDILDAELRKKLPDYQGMHGPMDEMQILGTVSASTVQKEIDKIDVSAIKQAEIDDKKDKKTKVKNALKTLGLTDDDLTVLNL